MQVSRRVGVGVALGVAVAAGAAVWFAVNRHEPTAQGQSSNTTDLSAQRLRALGALLGRPIYWAGPRARVTYEFTETADMRMYVRYLPRGVAAGSSKPFLTVATYPLVNAFAVTSSAARNPGAVKVAVGGGAVAFYNRTRPTNAYIAFPGSDVQIEVYDPSVGVLRRLMTAGAIRRIGASPILAPAVQARALSTTRAGLRSLSSRLGRAIYWLGPIRGSSLELTHAPDGRVYVRYLPPGVRAGAATPYLTIATYPIANGLAVTTAASMQPGAVRIALPNGAVAFFSRTRPTSVYVAFPGVGEQIEVFDPSASRARALVAAGRVKPVG
jgi:hypothetical protein